MYAVIKLSKQFSNISLAVIGAILIAPFSALVALAILLNFLGAPPLNLANTIEDGRLTLLIVIIFPLVATVLNASALFIEMTGKRMVEILSWQFMFKNILSMAVAGAAVLALLFLFGHDAIPCMIKNTHSLDWQSFRHVYDVCKNA